MISSSAGLHSAPARELPADLPLPRASSAPANFDQFWLFYLGEHQLRWTKRMHVTGTAIGFVCHVVMLPLTRNLWWFPLGFAVGYFFAWVSHFFLERNQPASFRYPYWSFFADLELFHFMLHGTMDTELRRVAASPGGPAPRSHRLRRGLFHLVVGSYFALLMLAWGGGVVGS